VHPTIALQKKKPRQGIATVRTSSPRRSNTETCCKRKSPVRGLQRRRDSSYETSNYGHYSCKRKSPVRGLQQINFEVLFILSHHPLQKKKPRQGIATHVPAKTPPKLSFAVAKEKAP